MSKYGNKKCEYEGLTFHSEMERNFYIWLKQEYPHEEIKIQPKFELLKKFEKNGKKYRGIEYIADFQIGNIVFDVKGFSTADFKIKSKMFESKYMELKLALITEAPKYLELRTGCPWVALEDLAKVRKERKKLLEAQKKTPKPKKAIKRKIF